MKIWSYVLLAVFGVAALFVYLIPSLIAFRRAHPNKGLVFLVNLLLGVTLLGWIGALLWSTTPLPARER